MDSNPGEAGVMRLPPGFDPRRMVAVAMSDPHKEGAEPEDREAQTGALGGLPLQEMPRGEMDRTDPHGDFGAAGPAGASLAGPPGAAMPLGEMNAGSPPVAAALDVAAQPEGAMPGMISGDPMGSFDDIALGVMEDSLAGFGVAGAPEVPAAMESADPTQGLPQGMPAGEMEVVPDTFAPAAAAAAAEAGGITLEGRWRLTFSTITAGRSGD